ncbi:hypothetical protein IPG41_06415 [Candidatus Peregrinibacteria bacterium]|nr:MAG: hypothetical protein IPG41_06415 [Candidatus Peregrinibacteria bacterium]
MENVAHFTSTHVLLGVQGHWYFLGLNIFDKNKIETLNFVHPDRLEQMQKTLFSRAQLQMEVAWNPTFKEEVHQKVHADASAYLPFLQEGRLALISGSSSDTLFELGQQPEEAVYTLASWMEAGKAGPYLRFR